jgi:hypothetical protein
MKSLPALALFLIAISAVSTGVRGQNVYKCGATYSQTPCPDGKAIQINDSRSAAQRSAAKQAAERDAAKADAMETDRLAQEKAAQDAADAAAKAAKPADAPNTKADKSKHKAERKAANFSAKVIESKKKSTP